MDMDSVPIASPEACSRGLFGSPICAAREEMPWPLRIPSAVKSSASNWPPGRRVSRILTESPQLYGLPVIAGAVGVTDRFGDSGAPWELMKEFEISARAHCRKKRELTAFKKKRAEQSREERERLFYA